MKLRARLLIYNVIIVVVSFLLMAGIFGWASWYRGTVLRDTSFPKFDADPARFEKRLGEESRGRELYIYEDGKILTDREGLALPRMMSQYQENEKKFFWYLVAMVVGAIALVVAIAVVLSKYFFRAVSRPLALLEDGAKRVYQENYTEEIRYHKHDEFLPVVSSFNAMQKKLKNEAEASTKIEQAKRTMMRGISHDVRTPLTVVKGNIKGVLDGAAKDERRYLETAYARSLDIEELLQKLFEAYDAETGETLLRRERTELGEYLRESMMGNERVADGTLALEFDLPPEKVEAEIDRVELKRVLDNLIKNTVQHNRTKRGLRMKVTLTQKDRTVEITFEDNGQGVKDKNLPYLFDEFFKEDASRSEDKGSSGLGLAICRRIVEAHNGTITVENRQGLCFIIKLEGV